MKAIHTVNILATILTILKILIISQAQNVIVDLNNQCYTPLQEKANNDTHSDKLNFDEYLLYIQELIDIDPDPIYQQIDLQDTSIRANLEQSFQDLTGVVCTDIFRNEGADVNCSENEIIIYPGIKTTPTSETLRQKIFLFAVCENSLEFLRDEVKTSFPSSFPSIAPSLPPSPAPQPRGIKIDTFPFNIFIETSSDYVLDDEASESLKEQVLDAFEEAVVNVVSENKDRCSINYTRSTLVSAEIIECSSRRRNPNSKELGEGVDAVCFEFKFQAEFSYVPTEDECENIDFIRDAVTDAITEGSMDDTLCPDAQAVCDIITFVNRNTAIIMPVLYGLAGGVFVLIGVLASRWNRKKNKDKNRDLEIDNPELQVNFPIPDLPYDYEGILVEQDIPMDSEDEAEFSSFGNDSYSRRFGAI